VTALARRAYRRGRATALRAWPATRPWSGVRVLGYHRVSDDDDPLAVRPRRFAEHLDAAVQSGARPLRLADAADALSRGGPERYFCVTFDDGYADNNDVAAPILRAAGVPATVFLPVAIISGDATYEWYGSDGPAAMTWDEVRTLHHEGLIDFQSHGCTHAHLPTLPDGPARDEVRHSKSVLEAALGGVVTCFCYPAGRYGEREVAYAREAGYRLAVTTRGGLNTPAAPLLELRRAMIGPLDTGRDIAALFAGVMDRPDPVTRVARALAQRARPARSGASVNGSGRPL
jgi:peptidoglycan/xylan/chitin deacetylase (PgdA/CDA1 family)